LKDEEDFDPGPKGSLRQNDPSITVPLGDVEQCSVQLEVEEDEEDEEGEEEQKEEEEVEEDDDEEEGEEVEEEKEEEE